MADDSSLTDCSNTRLQTALKALQENKQSEAISTITSLKPHAAQLCSKLEHAQEKLTELEKSLYNQIQFLSYHIKMLEKKERALSISKSISESIQHTQYKKLQALKWELMKARNALFIARKELARKEKQLAIFNDNGLPPNRSTAIQDVSVTVETVEHIVNTLDRECTQKKNNITDTSHKISELKRKFELQTHETSNLREIVASLKSRAKEMRALKSAVTQAIILWTLVTKAFDNGHKKEQVLSSIAEKAYQIRGQNSDELGIETLTSSRGLFQRLHPTPHCLLCCVPLLPTDRTTCEHCQSRDRGNNNKVFMETFCCTDQGTVAGSVRVRNIAYDKHVVVRYSQDTWTSSNDQQAVYKHSNGNCDFFQFQLPFDISASLNLEFAVCYRVAGEEFWDNNEGRNYKVIFYN